MTPSQYIIVWLIGMSALCYIVSTIMDRNRYAKGFRDGAKSMASEFLKQYGSRHYSICACEGDDAKGWRCEGPRSRVKPR